MERPTAETKGIRPGVLLILVAILVALGVAIVTRSRRGPARPVETAAPPAAPTELVPPERIRVATGPRPAAPPTRPAAATPAPPGTATPATEPVVDWGARLDDVLGSSAPESAKAAQLLEIWPGLPADGQVEVMQHIANLLPDDRFALLHNTFTNARTQEPVLDVIMTDALNRPNGIKLPALLDVARVEGHPKAAEAREILEVFVEADHGTDWPRWEQAVQKFLQENPDEGPPDPPVTPPPAPPRTP